MTSPPPDDLILPPDIILVDDLELRDTLVRALWASGLERSVALRTAREALMVMAAAPAQLVIMDVTLAHDDVYPNGCVAALDVVRRWPGTRILFLTGWSPGDPEMVDCPKGAPVLEKPFGPHALIHRVKDVLGRPPWSPTTPREG